MKGSVTSDVDEIFASGSACKLVVMNSESFDSYKSQLISTGMQVVDEEWVKECFTNNKYVAPEPYSSSVLPPASKRYEHLGDRMFGLEELDTILGRIEVGDNNWNYLQDVVVHLQVPDKKEHKIQKKLVHIGGGFVVDGIYPHTTHVVTMGYSDEDLRNFRQYNQVQIVNTFWLKQCMYVKKRVMECDYRIKANKKLLAQISRELGTGPIQPVVQVRSLGAEKRTVEVKSDLFKDLTFFMDEQVKRKMDFRGTLQRILENGGMKLKTLQSVKEGKYKPPKGKILCVIPDGSTDIALSIQQYLGNDKSLFISPRWIDYCIERNVVLIDFLEAGRVDFLPFPFETPYKTLLHVKVTIGSSVPIEKKPLVKGIVNAIGMQMVLPADPYDFEVVDPTSLQSDSQPEDRKSKQRDIRWLISLIKKNSLE